MSTSVSPPATEPSPPPSPPPPPSQPQGRTLAGYTFTIPPTTDMFRTLLTPSRLGPAELLTLVTLLSQVATLPLIRVLPPIHFVRVFLFWRLCYNLGIGLLLRLQSNHNLLISSLQALPPDARKLLHWFVARPYPKPYSWTSAPAAFNAWISFRALATLILSNDGLSFFLLSLACFRLPKTLFQTLILLLTLPVALPLAFFSFWAKAHAHHALSDYAWFWGDFFFLRNDSKLVSTGVFAIVPHPMYTAGYLAYYAIVLITRSYLLLAVSVFAHMSQLFFLFVFEEPHIQKLYPSPPPSPPSSAIDDPAFRLYDQAAPHPIVALALLISFLLLILPQPFFFAPSSTLVFFITLVVRLAHWYLLSVCLPPIRTRDNRFVLFLRSYATSHSRIFAAWQHLYLVSVLLNHGLFLLSFLTFPGAPLLTFTFCPKHIALTLSAIFLIAIGLAAHWSSLQHAGLFSWYYGDFFVSVTPTKPTYNGAFTFVDHPQLVLGYLVYYGMALWRQSYALAALAILSQLLHLAFIITIEEPHLRKEYKQVRPSPPWKQAFLAAPGGAVVAKVLDSILAVVSNIVLPHVGSLQTQVSAHVERAHTNVFKEVDRVRQSTSSNISQTSERMSSSIRSVNPSQVIATLSKYGAIVEDIGPSADDDKSA